MNPFNLKINILLLSVSLSITFHVSSQNHSELACGTVTSPESLEFYKSINSEIKKNEKKFISKSVSGKESHNIKTEYIPIKIHIVRNSKGNDGLDIEDLNKAVENINSIFKDIYIQFSVNDNINYIDNDAFNTFKKSEESQLTKNNYIKGALNIYFLKNIENDAQNSICGYTNINKNANIILIKNSCVTNDTSLAHEIGHFLSLVHTHGPNDNKTTELVNGSNCDTDGDGICDTPADPKLDTYNVNNFCDYIGTSKDANGDKYNPDTQNIMSYSYKGCRTHFSKQQQARMYAFYQYIKILFPNEISVENEEPLLANTKIYPNPVSDGTLKIDSKIGQATHYQISNLYGQVLSKGILNNKEINVSDLASGTYILSLNDGNNRAVKKFVK